MATGNALAADELLARRLQAEEDRCGQVEGTKSDTAHPRAGFGQTRHPRPPKAYSPTAGDEGWSRVSGTRSYAEVSRGSRPFVCGGCFDMLSDPTPNEKCGASQKVMAGITCAAEAVTECKVAWGNARGSEDAQQLWPRRRIVRAERGQADKIRGEKRAVAERGAGRSIASRKHRESIITGHAPLADGGGTTDGANEGAAGAEDALDPSMVGRGVETQFAAGMVSLSFCSWGAQLRKRDPARVELTVIAAARRHSSPLARCRLGPSVATGSPSYRN